MQTSYVKTLCPTVMDLPSDFAKLALPSSKAGPSQISTPLPRQRQKLTPSKFYSLLFSEESDKDSSGTNSSIDSKDNGWSSSSDEDESLHAADDRELLEGEADDERQPSLSEPSGFSFAWSEGSDFVPDLHEFQSDRSGITKDWPCNDEAKESDFFRAFLDDEVMSYIAEKTNNYYRWESQRMNAFSPKSRFRQWVDTTSRELLVFIALMLVMPLCKKHVLQHYWRNDSLISTPIFNKYMTRDRFLLLLSFLYYADNENRITGDRIWQVREILSMFLTRYKKYFYPFQKMVVDEAIILFKGRLVFKQYIPTKRHRFGIKLFVLCDCDTGIVLDMIVYTGTDIDIPKASKNDPMGMSGAIVKKMMAPYMGRGHILYTDNWYTSPALCQFLHDNNTGSCGTVRKNRKFIPKFNGDKTTLDNPSSDDETTAQSHPMKDKKRRKKNLFIQKEKSGKVIAVKWNDKKPVHLLSTIHKGDIVTTGKIHYNTKKIIMKPDVVIDYTKNMRLVDKSDSQISSVECLRKSVMWYHKFFFHMIDITMLNAYNFWLVKREMNPSKKLKLREFIHKVAFQLLEEFGQPTNTINSRRHAPQPDRIADAFHRHFAVPTDMLNEQKRRLDCYVCKNTTRRPSKRMRVTYKCNECNIPLCLYKCFKDYHTLIKI